jgi:hypothetical protein
MKIHADPSALAETNWHEYAVRFFSGGIITVMAGIIAKEFGPVIGGLFLAFPAIFPASATLIEKHETEKKERAGLKGTKRAADAVRLDASGAAIGSIGLAVFALVVWRALPDHSALLVLPLATVAWLAVSFFLWELRERW